MIHQPVRATVLALLLLAPAAAADDSDAAVGAEIDYLIRSVGGSGCDFIRNGKRYPARDAENHLRMKYRRGRRYAPTADLFIERLASRSSMSGKPYWMACADRERIESGAWLRARLDEYRSAPPR